MSKWTNDSQNPAGPIQVNRFNKAWGKFRSEHQTKRELWGVIGGEEHECSMVEIFGVNNRPEVTAASDSIGDKYQWTVSKANVNQIVADIEVALPALVASRPCKDTRITMEAHLAEQEANRVEAEALAKRTIRFNETCPEFQATIKRIAKVGGRRVEWVYGFWEEYANRCAGDQSAVMFEFVQSYQEKLGASLDELRKAIEAPTALGTVARNHQHDGVEISFFEKPSDSLRYQLQRAGFRITRRPPWKWYQKYSQSAWDKACELAGIVAPAPKQDADPAGAYVQAQEDAFQDAECARIGA